MELAGVCKPVRRSGKGTIMADEDSSDKMEVTPKSRRDFVKTSAQVAVTAPAVAMLLSASTKQAFAGPVYNPTNQHILDDFTFGNDEEDVDAHNLGSNFSNFNGVPQQDDHV